MKAPIALLMNDLHISKDTISDFWINWEEALQICKDRNIVDLVIGGDMFTARASQSLGTLMAVKEALDKAVKQGIYVTIANGNHDKVSGDSLDGYNTIYEKQDIEVIPAYKTLYWDDCPFVMIVMSYFTENEIFEEKLKEAEDDAMWTCPEIANDRSNIILYIHEGVHGALGDFEIAGELRQEIFEGFKAVLCGHYHNRVKIKNTNIEYIGSSRQHNFGEDEEKGYTILFDDGSYEFVKNEANIRYKTIEADVDKLPNLKAVNDDRYRYKLKINCNDKQAAAIDKQHLFDLGFSKVDVKVKVDADDEVQAADMHQKYDKNGIKKEYVKYCSENNINSELGIKYLD